MRSRKADQAASMETSSTKDDVGKARYSEDEDDTSKGKARQWNMGRWSTAATVMLVLLIAIGVFVIDVKITHDNDGKLNKDQTDDTCDDIAIIGAGISGTYMAWKLREQNLSITVYEYSDRIGGRFHTVQFPGIPDVNVELGAMRFIPPCHPLMTSIVEAVNLSIVDFRPGLGLVADDVVYLRSVHMRRRDMGNNNPYNLKPSERHMIHDPDALKTEYFVNATSYDPETATDQSDWLYSKTFDGVPLYKQSVSGALTAMGASQEAQAYFRDTIGFLYFTDDIQSSMLEEMEDYFDGARPVKTIEEGFQALPERLLGRFLEANKRHRLLFNHQLTKIDKQQDRTYQLQIEQTETTGGHTSRKPGQPVLSRCAKKVVLSLPVTALRSVDWEGFRDPKINGILENAMKDMKVAKIFLAYDRPWWRDLPSTFTYAFTDLPVGQTADFGTSKLNNKAVLLAGYLDRERVKFWREMQSRDTSKSSSGPIEVLSDASLFFVTKILAELFNISSSQIPEPNGHLICFWDEFPYGGAAQLWMPGFEWTKVGREMMKPSDSDEVYVASNGFSKYYGTVWAESALDQVEMIMENILT